MWDKILGFLGGLIDIGALAKRALDQVDAFRQWMFITERTAQFDQAEKKLKETGDTDELENLLRDPNRDQ